MAQGSHAGKNAPSMSKEGVPASEQPHSDSSGTARTPAPTGHRLIQRAAQQGNPSAKYESASHRDRVATFILTLRRAAISRDGCDRREGDVRISSEHLPYTGTASNACRKLP